jgi:mRNA-degrading endonuclease RelE of RelBE toxin-antitoxin system
VDILIESTKKFEKDMTKLSEKQKAAVIQKINECASLFPHQKVNVYRKLRRLPLSLRFLENGYQSSLYTLRISKDLRVVLAVDEDPIFEQTIFTLFRAVRRKDIEKAYKGVAESLYQELRHPETLDPAQVS